MSRFTGFSEKSFLKKSEIWANYGKWCYRFKFLEGIRLHWLFHAGFGEIRFLKWRDVINSNSSLFLLFGNINRQLRDILLNRKNHFSLKIKKDFNKNQYFICQILKSECWDPPTHSHQFEANYGKIQHVTDP